jgi:hypothetical protein
VVAAENAGTNVPELRTRFDRSASELAADAEEVRSATEERAAKKNSDR